MNNKDFLIAAVMATVLIVQVFFLGWYSGKNHERLQWSLREINCQADLEGERVRNDILNDLVR